MPNKPVKLNKSPVDKMAFRIAYMLLQSELSPRDQIIALSKAIEMLAEIHNYVSELEIYSKEIYSKKEGW